MIKKVQCPQNKFKKIMPHTPLIGVSTIKHISKQCKEAFVGVLFNFSVQCSDISHCQKILAYILEHA
jgi:hypothetical protein